MTSLGHLVDNAVSALEHGRNFDTWRAERTTHINKRYANTSLSFEDIWEIANYIYYDYRHYIEDKTRAEMIEKYGYEIN